MDEINAHYAAETLSNKNILERLVSDKPTIKDKVLNFFKSAFGAYKGDVKLQGAAKKLYNQYKKLFDEFSARNHGMNSAENIGVNSENNLSYIFKGYAEDGKGQYESNFPKGTPKTDKGERILKYIQNVWSKKPITLRITDNEGKVVRNIEAQFDPYYSEDKSIRTDASKLMGGNRRGSAGDRRVTLDLADDYYKIASEAVYDYSSKEIGKDSPTHEGVKEWHYFVNDIYFAEKGSKDYEPYTVTINVKERDDGAFVYSFSAEKNSEHITRQTLYADVTKGKTQGNDVLTKNSISQSGEKSNGFEKKSAESSSESSNYSNSGKRAMFAGEDFDAKMISEEEAKGAQVKKLIEAKRMLAQGVGVQSIKESTGWFRGVDGVWKMTADREVKDKKSPVIKHKKYSLEEIENNIKTVTSMQSVCSIDASMLEKTGESPSKLFDDFFNKLGNNIRTDEFGDVALLKSSRKSEIRHGVTAEKIASMEAIPSVLANGKVIFAKNKNDVGLERVVVAAPIKIGTTDYLMGVMLQRDAQHQRLYLHNVLVIDKETAKVSNDNKVTTWSNETNDNLSITSILQNALFVKDDNKNLSVNDGKAESKSDEGPIRWRDVEAHMIKEGVFGDGDGEKGAGREFAAELIEARGLPRHGGTVQESIGNRKQREANYTRNKVYTKQKVLKIVDSLKGVKELSVKTRAEVSEALWQVMNESTTYEQRLA